MTEIIETFEGEFEFLSNFSNHAVMVGNRIFPTVEHAFQAAKTFDQGEREHIARQTTPGRAKRAGRQVTLRPNWDDIKIDIMRIIVEKKFSQHPELAEKLLATGDAEIIEGNWWHDEFWGVCILCGRRGENHLGRILMEIRVALRESM